MMRFPKFLFFSLILFALSSCLKIPTAEFTAFPSSPVAGETINFANTSRDASRFEWNFGDGRNSEEAEPAITYSVAGEYMVSLTARHGLRSNSFHSVIVVRP